MKKWGKLAIIFSAIILLIIYAFNFSAYNFSEERNLYIQIAIDQNYIDQNPHWGFIVPEMLENVSEFYWQEFKIRLIWPENYILFKSKNELAGFEELDFLSKSVPESDLIIGFTGRKLPKSNNKPVYAESDFFMISITNQYPPSGQTQLVKHEIAHLFLFFVLGHQSGTLMDKTLENFVMSNDPAMQNFNNFHKTLIRFNQYRNFKIIKLFYRLIN